MSGYDLFNLISLGLLGALLLRRVVRMERFYWPRVVLLTVILWAPAAYLFLLPYASDDSDYYCVPSDEGAPRAFCISEY